MSTTQTGVVKWFNDGKGFGFITPEDGSKDLFAHFSEIRNNGGFRSLAENQRVEFEVKQGPKGLQAANIRPLLAGPGRHRRPDLTGRSCRLTNKKTAPVKVAVFFRPARPGVQGRVFQAAGGGAARPGSAGGAGSWS